MFVSSFPYFRPPTFFYASSGRFGMFMFQVLQKAGIRGCKVF